jgi:multiple sugar transport system substrate-binding protein
MHSSTIDPSGGLDRPDMRSRIGALIAVIALVATACGGGSGGAGASGDNGGGGGNNNQSFAVESESSGLQPPTAKVSLNFWTPFSGADGDQMDKLVKDFNAETPNVQVTLRRINNPDYYKTVNNAIQAKQTPQLMIMHVDQLARYAGTDILQPVDDLVSTLKLKASDFTEAVWNGAHWKGKQYSIPLDVHPQVLYYDKKALTDAGVTKIPPTDQASFEDALAKCKASGKDQGFFGNHAFSAGLTWVTLFYQLGGKWTDADYNVTVNSDAGVKAAQYMKGLIDKGLQPKNVNQDAELSNLESGTSCFATTGIWQTARLQKSLGEDFGEAPMPQIFGKGVWAGSHTMAIQKDVKGDELKGAYYFIDWISRHSVTWAAGGQLPARTQVRESQAFKDLKDIPNVAPEANDAQFPPPIPGAADIFFGPGGVYEKLADYLKNGGDPKAGLDAAAKRYTDEIKKTRADFGF